MRTYFFQLFIDAINRRIRQKKTYFKQTPKHLMARNYTYYIQYKACVFVHNLNQSLFAHYVNVNQTAKPTLPPA